MRALPEQIGAAVVALQADMRIEEEHRRPRRFDVALHQRAIQIELQQYIPDRLMHGEAVRVLFERGEQELECLAVAIARREMPAEREPRPPVLRIGGDQFATAIFETLRMSELLVEPFEAIEGEIRAIG